MTSIARTPRRRWWTRLGRLHSDRRRDQFEVWRAEQLLPLLSSVANLLRDAGHGAEVGQIVAAGGRGVRFELRHKRSARSASAAFIEFSAAAAPRLVAVRRSLRTGGGPAIAASEALWTSPQSDVGAVIIGFVAEAFREAHRGKRG